MNISRFDVNSRINAERNFMTSTPQGKQWKDDVLKGLPNCDTDKDGLSTGKELTAQWQDTFGMLAGNDKALKEKGEYLTPLFQEVIDKYAGDDGIFDAYEMGAMLSDENYMKLVDEYHESFGEAFDNYFGTDVHSKDKEAEESKTEEPEQDKNFLFEKLQGLLSKLIDKISEKSGEVTRNGIDSVNNRQISNRIFETLNSDTKKTADEYMNKLADMTFKQSSDILSLCSGSNTTSGIGSIMSEMQQVSQTGIQKLDNFNSKMKNDELDKSTNPFNF
ncbi:hypothetical protein II906_00295 [bacterium]|nr:hypothetical protein [bacterium]